MDQSEVTVDGLSNALDDLIKAADATDLIKGGFTSHNRPGAGGGDANGVENSGHYDEDGKRGGNRGSMADAGKLDAMMIGKLANAGVDASTIAAFSDFVGKAKAEPDEDEGGGASDDDEDDQEMEGAMRAMRAYKRDKGSLAGFPGFGGKARKSGDGGERLQKSLEQFRADPDISDALDVSPYLEAMTTRTAEQIDAVHTVLSKSAGEQSTVNRAMAAAVYQMGTLLKSQSAVVNTLAQRLGLVEKQPMPQRGVTDAARASMRKSMPNEAGGDNALSKSETLAVLSYMNLEKGMKQINGQRTIEAIGLLEGGGQVSRDVIAAAQAFVTQHPAEAQVARSYH
jgi:hypothetical protein